MNTFVCKSVACGKQSKASGIHHADDRVYVVCEHCGSKNEVKQLPTVVGAPAEFHVVGLLADRP
jgi:DNA-directed RNA polymerase subunit RPC12/RpoP